MSIKRNESRKIFFVVNSKTVGDSYFTWMAYSSGTPRMSIKILKFQGPNS